MLDDYVCSMERESIAWVESIDRDPFLGSVIRGDASRRDYLGFLASTYHYVRWSGPLLAATAEGLRRNGRYPWLLALVDAKAKEESPHDAWVLGDLKTCGANVELVKASPTPKAIQAYVQWSLTLAEDGTPGYLGAAYTLEFASMHRASVAARNLCERGAIAKIQDAVTFLEGHGDADSGHVALLGTLLRRIDDPSDQDAIVLSAAVMRTLYPRFFRPWARREALALVELPAWLNVPPSNDNATVPSDSADLIREARPQPNTSDVIGVAPTAGRPD